MSGEEEVFNSTKIYRQLNFARLNGCGKYVFQARADSKLPTRCS